MWRSSEIRRAAMNQPELADDIKMLEHLASLTGKLVIYSARDDKLQPADDKNYGYESKKFYKNIVKQYYNFPPRSKMNRAFELLCKLTNNMQEKNFLKNMHSTKWLLMIEDQLWLAKNLFNHLRNDTVLVHCQTGNDATSVITSLV